MIDTFTFVATSTMPTSQGSSPGSSMSWTPERVRRVLPPYNPRGSILRRPFAAISDGTELNGYMPPPSRRYNYGFCLGQTPTTPAAPRFTSPSPYRRRRRRSATLRKLPGACPSPLYRTSDRDQVQSVAGTIQRIDAHSNTPIHLQIPGAYPPSPESPLRHGSTATQMMLDTMAMSQVQADHPHREPDEVDVYDDVEPESSIDTWPSPESRLQHRSTTAQMVLGAMALSQIQADRPHREPDEVDAYNDVGSESSNDTSFDGDSELSNPNELILYESSSVTSSEAMDVDHLAKLAHPRTELPEDIEVDVEARDTYDQPQSPEDHLAKLWRQLGFVSGRYKQGLLFKQARTAAGAASNTRTTITSSAAPTTQCANATTADVTTPAAPETLATPTSIEPSPLAQENGTSETPCPPSRHKPSLPGVIIGCDLSQSPQPPLSDAWHSLPPHRCPLSAVALNQVATTMPLAKRHATKPLTPPRLRSALFSTMPAVPAPSGISKIFRWKILPSWRKPETGPTTPNTPLRKFKKSVGFYESPKTGRPITGVKKFVTGEAMCHPSPISSRDDSALSIASTLRYFGENGSPTSPEQITLDADKLALDAQLSVFHATVHYDMHQSSPIDGNEQGTSPTQSGDVQDGWGLESEDSERFSLHSVDDDESNLSAEMTSEHITQYTSNELNGSSILSDKPRSNLESSEDSEMFSIEPTDEHESSANVEATHGAIVQLAIFNETSSSTTQPDSHGSNPAPQDPELSSPPSNKESESNPSADGNVENTVEPAPQNYEQGSAPVQSDSDEIDSDTSSVPIRLVQEGPDDAFVEGRKEDTNSGGEPPEPPRTPSPKLSQPFGNLSLSDRPSGPNDMFVEGLKEGRNSSGDPPDPPRMPSPELSKPLENMSLSGRRSSDRRELRKKEEERKRKEKEEEDERRRAAEEEAARQERAREAREAEELRVQQEREAEEQMMRQGVRRMPRDPIIQPLSAEAEQRVQAALRKGMTTQVAFTSEGTPITRRDIGKVLPQPGSGDDSSGWLNDEIIGAYLQAIVEYAHKANHRDHRGDAPKYHAFSAFFYTNLKKPGGFEHIKRWATRARISGPRHDFLKVEYVFVPINVGGNHWTLAVVSPIRKTIEYFDSMHGSARTVYTNIKTWLSGELGARYHEDEWTIKEQEGFAGRGGGPTQDNARDCGVFTVTTAKMITMHLDPMAVGAADMPLQRRRIVAEILNGGFHGEFEPVVEFA